MCGINGFTFKDEIKIAGMIKATKHRGPDGSGVFVNDQISLGHNLLAIADKPENSVQPMVSDDFVLVYNGEIYNYKKLRQQIDFNFKTDSDTEVIFAGLAREGIDFLDKLDGMFAIAWYDKNKHKLFLARDSVGMKPIYYTVKNNTFIFSSELRGIFEHNIDRKLNHEMLPIFFALGYVPGNQTLIAGINKVMPGQIVEYDIHKNILKTSWLPLDDREKNNFEIKNAIADSVKEHTMGLRPFGLYLSGGLDSSIILHELSRVQSEKIKTYTTRFACRDHAVNQDADLAQRLCQDYNIEHHELLVTEQAFIDAIEPAISAMEEPRYNHSVPAYWLLAREASKDVTVILNGSGGDELFSGYGRYEVSKKISDRSRWPWWKLGYAFKGVTDPLSQWLYVHAIGDKKNALTYLRQLRHPRIKNPLVDRENAVAEYDRLFWLADEEFLRTDKLAMHFGMEGRFPLLSRSLRTLANSIPSQRKGSYKALLRQEYTNVLPDYIINKPKTGWNAPVTEWMEGKFGAMVRDVLRGDFIDLPNYTLASMKKILPLFYFRIWADIFKITL